MVGALLGILAGWPYLQITLEKLTTSAPTSGAVSGDTEYWCPMCPGVLSDWPAKCPVCNMTLVRRQKGEMTPHPDGIVSRVQLSPYRIQLAGLRTAPVEYRRLMCEVPVAGLLESKLGAGTQTPLILAADVFEPDASMVTVGQTGTVKVDGFPDEPVNGQIVDISPAAVAAAGRRMQIRVENPRGELRAGLYATATFQTPLAELESSRRKEHARWCDQTAVGLFVGPYSTFVSLIDSAARQVSSAGGLTLCIPESSVIDTGTKRVVYTVAMPGVFDAVEVQLGRRCGDHYPVRGGLDPGQQVVVAGAILLDAETRLNPSVAASYFGAAGRSSAASTPAVSPTPKQSAEDDAALIAKQKICPVTGELLGSMGAPVRVSVANRTVFVCCKGCDKPLLRKPDEYWAKLPK